MACTMRKLLKSSEVTFSDYSMQRETVVSRAKQRAIFAFCQQRGNRVKVAELFKLLADAGVPEIDI